MKDNDLSVARAKSDFKKISDWWKKEYARIRHDFLLKKAKEFVAKQNTKPTTK